MPPIKLLLSFAAIAALAGCAGAPGEMIADTNEGRTVYSKYFDGADWLIPDGLGITVVVDNDTPLSRQMFGNFQGKDGDGDGTVTVYFWNIGKQKHAATALRVACDREKIERTTPMEIGPGPFARTGYKLGTVWFFTYAHELKVTVNVDIDGQAIERQFTAFRRTVPELKKYFGPQGTPPYPWFAPKYAALAKKAHDYEPNKAAN
jgi:hypothetical protein